MLSLSFNLFNNDKICFSVTLSKELVDSSKINRLGFLYKALARPNLCLSPPDKF